VAMLQTRGDDATGEDDGVTEAGNGATDAGNGTVGAASESQCVCFLRVFFWLH
jgi:hypothetical protein